MRVDQYLPDLVPHDAISDHARRLRGALLAAGHDAFLHAAHVDRSLRGEADRWSPVSPCPPGDAVLLYHASTGSPQADWLADRAAEGARLAVDYHNVTPARYFDRWDSEAADRCRAGRRELARMAAGASLAVADSEYNEAELSRLGFARTQTCPLLVDLDAYRRPPEGDGITPVRPDRRGGGRRWLFVGRVAPNKCQHDVIAAFAVYRALYDRHAVLTLVGGTSSRLYLRALRDLCAEVGVEGAVRFLSSVPDAELRAEFRAADVFVCLSEHEGFCVPLLEAMVLDLPIVAYAAAAVPETVGPAGVLLEAKDPLVVAEAVAELLSARDRRDAVVAAGRRRAEEFALPVTTRRMVEALAGMP